MRGAAIFFHADCDVLVADDAGGGLQQVGYPFQVKARTQVATLLPRELRVGTAWTCPTVRAEVVERRERTVPAGTVDAWRIDHVLPEHQGPEHDLRLWIAPGTGIVPSEHRRKSTMGNEREIEPRTYRRTEAVDTARAPLRLTNAADGAAARAHRRADRRARRTDRRRRTRGAAAAARSHRPR